MDPRWLTWARELQTLAQTGLAYASDPYDRERYERIRAIAAEMLAEGAGLPFPAAMALFTADSGHATPKVDVRGVVFRAGRVLLVRERADGLWTVPGGWADPASRYPSPRCARSSRSRATARAPCACWPATTAACTATARTRITFTSSFSSANWPRMYGEAAGRPIRRPMAWTSSRPTICHRSRPGE